MILYLFSNMTGYSLEAFSLVIHKYLSVITILIESINLGF